MPVEAASAAITNTQLLLRKAFNRAIDLGQTAS
jgi:hypothetical protein